MKHSLKYRYKYIKRFLIKHLQQEEDWPWVTERPTKCEQKVKKYFFNIMPSHNISHPKTIYNRAGLDHTIIFWYATTKGNSHISKLPFYRQNPQNRANLRGRQA